MSLSSEGKITHRVSGTVGLQSSGCKDNQPVAPSELFGSSVKGFAGCTVGIAIDRVGSLIQEGEKLEND